MRGLPQLRDLGTEREGHVDPSLDANHAFNPPDEAPEIVAREPFADPSATFIFTPLAGNRGLLRWGSAGVLTPTCGTRGSEGQRACLRPERHPDKHDWAVGPAIKNITRRPALDRGT